MRVLYHKTAIFLSAILLTMTLGLTACTDNEDTMTPATHLMALPVPEISPSKTIKPKPSTQVTHTPDFGDPVISGTPSRIWGREFFFIMNYSDDSLGKPGSFGDPDAVWGHPLLATYYSKHTLINGEGKPVDDFIEYEFVIEEVQAPGLVSLKGRPVEIGAPISFIFKYSDNYDIKLTPGSTYQIYPQREIYSYGLIISQGSEIVFAGISDTSVDGRIFIDNDFFPISNPPFAIKQNGIDKVDYQQLGDEIVVTKVNYLAVPFSFYGKIFTLQQGQSAFLGGCEIDLLRAIEVDTKYKVPMLVEGPVNHFSFIFSKLTKSHALLPAHPEN